MTTHSNFYSKSNAADNGIFISLLILIFWLPLPLGSNRPWAWAIMEIWIIGLFILWLCKFRRGLVNPTQVFHKAKPIIAIFIIWLI